MAHDSSEYSIDKRSRNTCCVKIVSAKRNAYEVSLCVYAVIKGFHVYGLQPDVGDVLSCQREPDNPFDCEAVKILDAKRCIIGHVPARPIALNKAFCHLLNICPGMELKWYVLLPYVYL